MTPPSPIRSRRIGAAALLLLALCAAGSILYFRTPKAAAVADETRARSQAKPIPARADEPAAPKADPEPIPVAVPGLNENLYSWKSGDVFRFDYSKTITIKQLDEDGKPAERVTDISGFLIFEIKSISPAGASARLRIDSPHITIPEVTVYSSQSDLPETQAGKAKSIARAMEGALKTASWNVIVGSTGLIYIESRTPANLREWFKDVETAAAWRRKTLDANLPKLIEQDLGLKAPSHDRDILLYLGSAAQPGLAPADPLRPRRELIASAAEPDETKLAVTFKRVKPSEKEPYLIPGLVRDEISAELVKVSDMPCKAVFDTQLGMIDTLNEDYTIDLVYKYGPHLKLDQSVRVQYRLRRLAPPINNP